jgi:hypothetical protein
VTLYGAAASMMSMTEQWNARLGNGVLAHNESTRIPVLVGALSRQCIFGNGAARTIQP